jgi:hypothetical protein
MANLLPNQNVVLNIRENNAKFSGEILFDPLITPGMLNINFPLNFFYTPPAIDAYFNKLCVAPPNAQPIARQHRGRLNDPLVNTMIKYYETNQLPYEENPTLGTSIRTQFNSKRIEILALSSSAPRTVASPKTVGIKRTRSPGTSTTKRTKMMTPNRRTLVSVV